MCICIIQFHFLFSASIKCNTVINARIDAALQRYIFFYCTVPISIRCIHGVKYGCACGCMDEAHALLVFPFVHAQ